MAYRYFPAKTTAWLLSELEKAYDDQSAGKVIVSASAGDVSETNLVQVNVDERIRRLRHDLVIADPTNYAASDHIRQSRTRFAAS